MDNPIRAALDLVRLRHGRALAVIEGWFLVVMMVGGGVGIGYSLGGVRADYVLANQAMERSSEIARMQETNRQLLAIIQDRLPAVTSSAADRAAGAIQAAKGAASKATTAATKATAAAKSASTVVKKVDEALAPPDPLPAKKVPDWLNTP